MWLWDYVIPFTYGTVFGTLAFALYTELGEGMGKVWIRPNDMGQNVVSFRGLGRLMIEPLYNSAMWTPKNWDINYMVVVSMSGIISIMINKYVMASDSPLSNDDITYV